MKAGELIAIVDAVKPNDISEDIKLGWLGDAEGRVLCEIKKESVKDVTLIACGDDELSVPSPYSKMYSMYLVAMICFVKGEYEAYVKANQQYERAFSDYAKYCIRTRR